MNKQELVATVAANLGGVPKKVVEDVIVEFTKVVVASVAKKDAVRLVGFGTFEAREHAARKGRNPQTGKEIEIAAATVPAFKAGKAFKAAVNPAPKKIKLDKKADKKATKKKK